MYIIAFANQKGGVGKTTFTELISTEAERIGDGPVGIVDSDRQGNLTRWSSIRQKHVATPVIVPIPYDCINEETFQNLKNKGLKMLMFDTKPDAEESTFAIYKKCDLVVIPMKASLNDIWAASDTIKYLKEHSIPFVFVLNMVKPNVGATGTVAAQLSHFGPVLPTFIGDRTSYINAIGRGRTGAEEDLKKSAPEIEALYNDLRTFLHGNIKPRIHGKMTVAS